MNINNDLSRYFFISKQKIQLNKEAMVEKPNEWQGIKIRRQSNFKIAIVILLSKEGIPTALQALPYFILSKLTLLTSKQTSKKFSAKSAHIAKNLINIWSKYYFAEDTIGHACNIGQVEVLKNKQDYEKARDLLETCKTNKKHRFFKNIVIDPSADPQAMITDGICAGIRLDIARDYLIEKKEIQEIVHANANGASADAAANQAVYELFKSNEYPDECLFELFENLIEISQSENTDKIVKVDFHMIGQALIQADPELLQGQSFNFFSNHYRSLSRLSDDLPHLIKAIVSEELNRVISLKDQSLSFEDSWLTLANTNLEDTWTMKDPLIFQQLVLDKINEIYLLKIRDKSIEEIKNLDSEREKEINSLNWVVSFLQYKNGFYQKKQKVALTQVHHLEKKSLKQQIHILWKKLRDQAISIFGEKKEQNLEAYEQISHPWIRYMIKNLNKDDRDRKSYRAIAFVRGLKLESTQKIMGHHSTHISDESYLRNLPKLKPGTYAVDFRNDKQAHAITYIKVSDQEGYILDPNGFQIKCRDAEHTIYQFRKLLALYPEPASIHTSPIAEKGISNHQLHFQEIQKR